jgi:hypothetical protein
VNFSYTEEQLMLQGMVQKFVQKDYPIDNKFALKKKLNNSYTGKGIRFSGIFFAKYAPHFTKCLQNS